jgi:hypothetical protein
MVDSTYDPCLLYTLRPKNEPLRSLRSKNDPFSVVGLQTDDTLFLANQPFATAKQDELRKAGLMAKDREQLTETTPLKFNGCLITLYSDKSICLTQERQFKNL